MDETEVTAHRRGDPHGRCTGRSAARRPTRTWTTPTPIRTTPTPTRTTLTATPTTRTRSLAPSGAASSRSARPSSSPSTGSAGRSSSRATSRGATTTSSRRPKSSASSRRAGCASRASGSSRRASSSPSATTPTDIPWRPRASQARPTSIACSPSGSAARRSSSRAFTCIGPSSAPSAARSSATLGHPAQVNAYYTPRAAQGLPVHHDTHDVFVLQVAGEKRWLVYEPALELPLRNQKYSAELGEPGRARARSRPPAGRHALPAARLAPRGADLRLRLAPPHGRRQRRTPGWTPSRRRWRNAVTSRAFGGRSETAARTSSSTLSAAA